MVDPNRINAIIIVNPLAGRPDSEDYVSYHDISSCFYLAPLNHDKQGETVTGFGANVTAHYVTLLTKYFKIKNDEIIKKKRVPYLSQNLLL